MRFLTLHRSRELAGRMTQVRLKKDRMMNLN
jgi:hypothetical protein